MDSILQIEKGTTVVAIEFPDHLSEKFSQVTLSVNVVRGLIELFGQLRGKMNGSLRSEAQLLAWEQITDFQVELLWIRHEYDFRVAVGYQRATAAEKCLLSAAAEYYGKIEDKPFREGPDTFAHVVDYQIGAYDGPLFAGFLFGFTFENGYCRHLPMFFDNYTDHDFGDLLVPVWYEE